MLGGRRKLPVLAEISGPAAGDARAWSLRRADLEALSKPCQGLDDHRVALVVGGEGLPGAIALAGAASAAGRRTALLECDLATPRLAVELGLSPAPGLHEYLRWEATATEILQPLVLAGPAARGVGDPLICVVAGRPATDPTTLVKLESFRHALAKLRAAYDLTVLLGPPLEVTHGLLEAVAAQADTVLVAASPKGLSGQPGRLLRAQVRRLPADALGAIVVDSN
jgi:MinD-like ATPase involved in chromosome partitioning or flagellar assembly